jgi:glycerate dehydrogenase
MVLQRGWRGIAYTPIAMTGAKHAVFLELDSVDRGDLDLGPLQALGVDWRLYRQTTETELSERIHDAQLVVVNKIVLNSGRLEGAGALRLVCVAATGTNNVDLEAARRLGIAVTNARGYATPSVVQHVFALILALSVRLPQYQGLVAAGRWQRSPQFCVLDHPIRELAGRTLGIVGHGELGRAVGRIARAFGMEVLVSQRPGGPVRPGRVALHELLSRVDVLSLHCPLTETTRGFIGELELERMRPDALLINTARGGIVDEQALARALRAGRIGGAGVDVLATEPPVHGNPLLAPGIPNLIVTPHIAWASRESRQRLIGELAASINAFLQGQARNRVV